MFEGLPLVPFVFVFKSAGDSALDVPFTIVTQFVLVIVPELYLCTLLYEAYSLQGSELIAPRRVGVYCFPLQVEESHASNSDKSCEVVR